MLHHIFSACLLFGSLAVAGQNYIDLVKVDYALSPDNAFVDSVGATDLYEINADLTAPIVLNDRTALLTGVTFEHIRASFAPGRAQEQFSAIILKVGVNIKHSDSWSGTYIALPQISSDFIRLAARDYQLGGAVVMKHQASEHFAYKFGLYANSDRFGPFVVPMLGCYYLSPDERFEARILMPLNANVSWALNDNVRIGSSFKGQIKTFNVNTPVADEAERYLTKGARDIYAFFQYGLANGIHVQLAVGRTVGRTYRMFSEGVNWGMPLYYAGDDRIPLNTDFDDGWLFRAQFFYRLRTD